MNYDKCIILHDACDLRDFKSKHRLKKNIKNIYYLGSFYKGRGVEIIKRLAHLTPEFNYYLYGLRDENIKSFKNVPHSCKTIHKASNIIYKSLKKLYLFYNRLFA